MTMGKSWDTHCPFGPYIVTSDEIDDPHNLTLKLLSMMKKDKILILI